MNNGPYALVIFTADWNAHVESLISQHRHRDGLLVCPISREDLPLPQTWGHLQLPVDTAPWELIRAFRKVHANHVCLLLHPNELHGYLRYAIAALYCRARRYTCIDGSRLDLPRFAKAIATKSALIIAWRGLRFARLLAWLALPRLRSQLKTWQPQRTMHVETTRACWSMLGQAITDARLPKPIRLNEHAPRIAIFFPDLIGDTVTVIPLIRALRQHYPEACIHFYASTKGCDVLASCPWLNRLIPCPVPSINNHHRDNSHFPWSAWSTVIQAGRYDLLINGTVWPERIPFLAGLSTETIISRRIGDTLLPRAHFVESHGQSYYHFAEQVLRLCRPSRLEEIDPQPVLWLQHAEQVAAEAFLGKKHPDRLRIGIQSWAPHVPRRWPIRHFVSAMHKLHHAFECEFLIFDQPNACWQAHALPDAPCSWPGSLPLRQAMAALATCDLLLANDGGMGHIAACFRVPSVLVFTSVSSTVWKPPGQTIALQAEVPCGPCARAQCHLDLACHRAVTSERLVLAATQLINAARARNRSEQP